MRLHGQCERNTGNEDGMNKIPPLKKCYLRRYAEVGYAPTKMNITGWSPFRTWVFIFYSQRLVFQAKILALLPMEERRSNERVPRHARAILPARAWTETHTLSYRPLQDLQNSKFVKRRFTISGEKVVFCLTNSCIIQLSGTLRRLIKLTIRARAWQAENVDLCALPFFLTKETFPEFV